MKKRKISYLIIGLFILTYVMTACSAKSDTNNSNTAYDTKTSDSGSYDMVAEGEANFTTGSDGIEQSEAPVADGKADSSAGLQSSSTVSSGNVAAQEQDKIIRTFFMDVETQEFDSLITRINADIKRLNGYVESSNINGKGYNRDGGTRYGSIEARIPSDKVDEFVGAVNENANVVNQKETSENVSLKYIDAQSRVETLNIEQDRLFAILEKETSLDNIIVLESRLSDIRYELQNYESQLRYYDNMVAYSTVTLSIQEVEIFTPVTEEKQSLGTRMKNGFSDTMYHLSEGFQNFLVWLVVNLPYLIIWGIIIAVAAIITRRILKKSKANNGNPPTPQMYNLMQNMDQSNQNQNDRNTPNQG